MKSLLTYCVLIISIALLVAATPTGGIPDSEVGLSKVSVFEVPDPDVVVHNTSDPGDMAPVPGVFKGTPLVIPHGIADFTPILLSENQCVECHLVPEKIEGEPTPIPESHFIDFRNAPGEVKSGVAGARYLCVSCHVPQTDAKPLVDNEFKAGP